MSFLGLNEYQPLSPLEPEHPAIAKSAARAFLISLVLPGIGQVYAKRQTAGWVTCIAFFLSLLVGIGAGRNGQATLAGGAAFVAITLYIFGFLDAYFSTLEYNQGISTYLIGSSPRIAAILNFFTNGFGYFYLGDRGKGILMFLIMGALGRVLRLIVGPHVWLDYLWIVLQIAFAFDGYRIARKRLLESFPQLAQHSWRSTSTGQLTPAVPVSIAIVLVLPMLALVGLGGLAQADKAISLSNLDAQATPNGTEFTNKDLGLRFLLPDGWQVKHQPQIHSFYANKTNSNCGIILMRDFSLYSPVRFQSQMERSLASKPGYSVYGHRTGTLGGFPAVFMRVGFGTSVTEEVASTKIGFAIYTLVGIHTDEDSACPAQLDLITNSFRATR